MARRTQQGWAIAGKYGLYVGWSQTRVAAIAQHVSDLWSGRGGFGDISRFPDARGIDAIQADAWKRCKRNGDRAVRVTITYQEESS